MHVVRLGLRNVRRVREADLELAKGVNLIVGANAQGKTTLLETIHYLAATTSHRTRRDRDLVSWEESTASIHASVTRRTGASVSLRADVTRTGSRQFATEGDPRSAADFLGELAAVLFSVEDLHLIKGPPQGRRRFLNQAIAQTVPRYVDDLSRYRRALRQRNAMLVRAAGPQGSPADLAPWTESTIRYGAAIIEQRVRFIEQLAPVASDIHSTLARAQEKLQIEYRCRVPASERGALDAITAYLVHEYESTLQSDLDRATTHIGPHRDDLVLRISGKSAREFASQGQQRTAALALRLAEAKLAAKRLGEPPVLLLDDVMSELDATRANQVLSLVDDVDQILVTATHAQRVPPALEVPSRTFHVADGRVESLAADDSAEPPTNGEDAAGDA